MKKIYIIGFIITLTLIGIRIFVLRDVISVSFIIREVLIGLFAAHVYLAISYAGMSLIRIVFQSWFSELKIIGFWISSLSTTFLVGYFYVRTIQLDYWLFAAFSGFAMFIIGLLLENYKENVIEFTVDKEAKEIKDEDFKIQFK